MQLVIMKEKWGKKKKENTQKHNHTYKQTNKTITEDNLISRTIG